MAGKDFEENLVIASIRHNQIHTTAAQLLKRRIYFFLKIKAMHKLEQS